MMKTDSAYEIYRQKIQILNEYVWNNDKPWHVIEKWLENFTGYSFSTPECEKLMALHMLCNFNYFSQDMVRQMLKSCYEDLLTIPIKQEIRKKNNNTLDVGLINDELSKEIEATRFLGAGNPSESGSHLLYYFRQINDLDVKYFCDYYSIFQEDQSGSIILKDPTLKRVVFFDDLVGTGSQLKKFIEQRIKKIRVSLPDLEIQFISLFATHNAFKKINHIESFNGNAKTLFILDETYKAFGSKSRYFANREFPSRSKIKTFSRKYSQLLGCGIRDVHGFGYSQLMLGFSYNTPDNTIPIFWKTGSHFTPIFKRYSKQGSGL